MAYRGQLDEEDRNDYLARFGRAEPAHPERELRRAVLADAIAMILTDAKAAGRRSISLRDQRREALAWVLSEDRSDPFAFERICEALGIDAGWLRAQVLARQPLRCSPKIGPKLQPPLTVPSAS